MKWQRARQSQNVEDRRGRGPVKAGGVGLGAILIALIGGWIFGIDP
ncbi:MAG: neutral zinc metallopeptidase, partial [Rhodanobacteraceae bacterium]|nr:neutral zinc metallopeptidase [Rhodanobacteraceae bacterium]